MVMLVNQNDNVLIAFYIHSKSFYDEENLLQKNIQNSFMSNK